MIYLEFFCTWNLPFLLHVLIYSIIYLYQYELMDIYFILWVIIQYYSAYFVVHTVPALATGSSFNWLLCFSDTPPSMWFFFFLSFFWSLSLLSGTTRCSRLMLYMSCPSPRIGHFSEDLGTKYACCYWGITSFKPFQVTEQRNICVFTNLHTYTYL